jgi:hypothetical protein
MARPRNKDQKAQAEGQKSHQRLIDALTDLITREDSPVDSATLNEIRACWLWFPEGKKLVDRIEAIYSDKQELKKAVLLAAIVAMLERLIA